MIVGYAEDGAAHGNWRAFRWASEKGMKSVGKLLTDKNLLPSDWTLASANAITPNGVMLVGNGEYKVQRENGDNETLLRAWRAVIPRGDLF